VVAAAFDAVAEGGVAALTPAAVARRLEVPVAELGDLPLDHSTLVAAVIDELVTRLLRPPTRAARTTPREQLADHLDSAARRLRGQPALTLVMGELELAAQRDPAARALLETFDVAWHAWLIDVLDAGVACGEFRADLDTVLAAWTVTAVVRGLNRQPGEARHHPDLILTHLRHLLAAPDAGPGSAGDGGDRPVHGLVAEDAVEGEQGGADRPGARAQLAADDAQLLGRQRR